MTHARRSAVDPDRSDDGPTATPPPRPPWVWVVGAVVVLLVVTGGYFALGGDDDGGGSAGTRDSGSGSGSSSGEGSGAVVATPPEDLPPPLPEPGQVDPEVPITTVRYEVSSDGGTANAISFLGEGYTTAQVRGVALPWSVEVPLQRVRDTPLSLVAVTGPGASKISCRILIDGEEVAANTATAAPGAAICSEER